MINSRGKRNRMKKLVVVLAILPLQAALGATYDTKSFGDESCEVSSFTGFKYTGHRMRCPTYPDGKAIGLACKTSDELKTKNGVNIMLMETTIIILGNSRPNWESSKKVKTGYRFDKGRSIINDFWSSNVMLDVNGIDIYSVRTYDLNTSVEFTKGIESSRSYIL